MSQRFYQLLDAQTVEHISFLFLAAYFILQQTNGKDASGKSKGKGKGK